MKVIDRELFRLISGAGTPAGITPANVTTTQQGGSTVSAWTMNGYQYSVVCTAGAGFNLSFGVDTKGEIVQLNGSTAAALPSDCTTTIIDPKGNQTITNDGVTKHYDSIGHLISQTDDKTDPDASNVAQIGDDDITTVADGGTDDGGNTGPVASAPGDGGGDTGGGGDTCGGGGGDTGGGGGGGGGGEGDEDSF